MTENNEANNTNKTTQEIVLYGKFEADSVETVNTFATTLLNVVHTAVYTNYRFMGSVSVEMEASKDTPYAFMRIASPNSGLIKSCSKLVSQLALALKPAFPTASQIADEDGDAERYFKRDKFSFFITLKGDSLDTVEHYIDSLLETLKKGFVNGYRLGDFRVEAGGIVGTPAVFLRLSSFDSEFPAKCAKLIKKFSPTLKRMFPTVTYLPMHAWAIEYFESADPYTPMEIMEHLSGHVDDPSGFID